MDRYTDLLSQLNYLKDIEVKENIANVVFLLRDNRKIHLQIDFPDGFPYFLPEIRFNSDYYIPQLPHVSPTGSICYTEKDSISFSNNELDLLNYIFRAIEVTLTERNNVIEMHREFDANLATLKDFNLIYSFIDRTEKGIKVIDVRSLRHKLFYIKDKANNESSAFTNLIEDKFLMNINKRPYFFDGIYIRFEDVFEGKIPFHDYMWSNEEIANIIRKYNSQHEDLLKYRSNKNQHFYVLSFKTLAGRDVMIGLEYKKKDKFYKKVLPLLDQESFTKFKVTPYVISDSTYHSISKRGGMKQYNKTVLLVGCGSVGSEILMQLTRSGFERITIVDSDSLSSENTFRHYLGYSQYSKKVDLLKKEVSSKYPNVFINAMPNNIEYLIENFYLDFTEFDFIISATGDSNVDRWINMVTINLDIPIFYSWLEAYGIGGHCYFSKENGSGCLECLFSDGIHNDFSLVQKSDRPYTQNLDGCFGSYTPYGGLDAIETAILTVRKVVEYNERKLDISTLFTWKGDSTELRKAEFVESDYYTEMTNSKYYNLNTYRADCKICNGD